MNTQTHTTRNIILIAMTTGLLLLVPLLAMQFTSEVNWGSEDFIAMGILLFGTGLTYELITRKMIDVKKKVITGVIVGMSMLLIWAELAVGIFT